MDFKKKLEKERKKLRKMMGRNGASTPKCQEIITNEGPPSPADEYYNTDEMDFAYDYEPFPSFTSMPPFRGYMQGSGLTLIEYISSCTHGGW